MHHTAYEELAQFAKTLPTNAPLQIGDVGAYDVNGCLRPLFQNPTWTYRGLDLSPGPNVDIVLPSETNWNNIENGAFDVIVTVSTLEHTRRPWLVIQEIARILRSGGTACICAPFAWNFHEFPIDCWRIYPDGMRAMFADAGLKEQRIYMREFPGAPPDRGDTIAIATKP